MSEVIDQIDVAFAQRRTIGTLVTSQAIGALGITIGIATASLLATEISGSEEQAGLAQTFQVLGAALMAYLLARLMSRRGRRFGLVVGYLVGSLGGLLAVLAGVTGSMLLLLVGAAMLGSTTAANNTSRYAATDLAPAATRGRALSIVVWSTTIGAVVGPNLTGLSANVADLLGVPRLTGPFVVGSVGMAVAALVIAVFLRPDPLLLARQVALLEAQASRVETPAPVTSTSWGRVRDALRDRPTLVPAIVGLSGAHAAMVAVMVMTPLHMDHGGAELRVIGLVISLHVLGMFGFAPLVGWLADAVGRPPVLAAGGGVLLASLLLAWLSPEGSSWQIFGSLFLLGLGWSLSTVSASTMIADHAPLAARTDVQGAADLTMGLTAAAAGGAAGVVMGAFGYPTLALMAVTLAVAVLLAALSASRFIGSATSTGRLGP